MSLGPCEKCYGPLCTTSRVVEGKRQGIVACERCGHQVLDHPVLREAPGPAAQPTRVVKGGAPTDSAVNYHERITGLERLTKVMGGRIDLQQERAVKLEGLVAAMQERLAALEGDPEAALAKALEQPKEAAHVGAQQEAQRGSGHQRPDNRQAAVRGDAGRGRPR